MSSTVIPGSCRYCPHFDAFQRSCSHPSSQTILRDLAAGNGDCPVFDEVRADAMSDLEDRLATE
jgi:hypothetical protein